MSEGAHCLVVRVVDRFGDYGLVGLVMYEMEADRYKVDTLLLSCRVLGRGVEHALVSWLGQRAVKEGKRFVELKYLTTEKNRPALEFLTHLGDHHRNEASTSWTFPAECLAGVEYNPDATAPVGQELTTIGNVEKLTPRLAWGFGDADRSERLQRIGESLCDIDRLANAIEGFRRRKQPLHAGAA